MEKAHFVLQVNDVEDTREFLKHLNFEEQMYEPSKKMSLMVSPEHNRSFPGSILLVEDQNPYIAEAVTEKHYILQPGQKFYCEMNNLPEINQRLPEKYSHYIQEYKKTKWGNAEILLAFPEGYELVLWQHAPWSDEELLDYYSSLPTRLEQALEGLSEEQVHLVRAEGKWSIKQNALHLIDSHMSVPVRVKFALAENGRQWVGNAYNQDVWAENLQYDKRAMEPEVRFFRAAVESVRAMIKHFKQSLDKYIVVNGNNSTIRDTIKLNTLHALGHIERIRETREIHNV